MQTIRYAEKDIPVLYDVDCCVCGGGTAGVPAAVMAQRGGQSTLLVEKSISLGGSQTLGLVLPFMPTFAPNSDTPWIVEIKRCMQDEGIAMEDGTTSFGWFNPEKMVFIYEKLLTKAGGRILYDADLIDTKVEKGNIRYIIINTIEGLAAIKANTFIDSTGDAVLSRLAGVRVERGYEKTGNNQPMTFRFEMAGIDLDQLCAYTQSIGDTWCKTLPPYFEIAMARHRDIKYTLEPLFVKGYEDGELTLEDIEYFQAFTILGKSGCMSMNCPEIPVRYKATKAIDRSEAVTCGRAMMQRISSFLIRHMPGFEHAYISREPVMLGARESFRIVGKYQMTETDYYGRSRFDDAVVCTAWYIDAHGEKVGEYLAEGEYYEIPYRSLVTEEIDNLLVAGRCISTTFILQASMRIQPTCMTIGEAAGVAAAWAGKQGIAVNMLDWTTVPKEVKPYKK